MLKRIVGAVLVIVAVASLAFSLVATVAVWNYRQPLAETATAGLHLLDETLGTTTDAFAAVEEALAAASGSVASAQDTFKTLSVTVGASGPTLDSLALFLGEGLPATLASTRDTLDAAAESAKVIDDVLAALSGLPLFNISYNPDTPLSESLAGIGASLETLPETMDELGGNLAVTSKTLPALAASMDELGSSMDQINASLASASQVVAAYKGLVQRYQAAIRSLEAFIPTLVLIAPIVFTFFAFWLAVVQAAALLKGWEWLRSREPEDNPAPLPQPAG